MDGTCRARLLKRPLRFPRKRMIFCVRSDGEVDSFATDTTETNQTKLWTSSKKQQQDDNLIYHKNAFILDSFALMING